MDSIYRDRRFELCPLNACNCAVSQKPRYLRNGSEVHGIPRVFLLLANFCWRFFDTPWARKHHD